jgi:hypothetical protein
VTPAMMAPPVRWESGSCLVDPTCKGRESRRHGWEGNIEDTRRTKGKNEEADSTKGTHVNVPFFWLGLNNYEFS